jgi:magnesium-transporting ATPase (P-type)
MLLSAGLNVWMITGDKPETAVAISQQCGLLTEVLLGAGTLTICILYVRLGS